MKYQVRVLNTKDQVLHFSDFNFKKDLLKWITHFLNFNHDAKLQIVTYE